MHVISFVAQKGGVAKTTTSVGLACAAVLKGKKAAVLDLDPQGSAAQWAEERKGIPGVAQLANVDHLGRAIESARAQGINWLIIDTPPRADGTAGHVASMSDVVFVPVTPGIFDVKAIRPTLAELYRAGAHTRTSLLFTLCPPRQGLRDAPAVAVARKAMTDAYGQYFGIAPCSITRYEGVRAALETSKTVVETDPSSKAAGELVALFNLTESILSNTPATDVLAEERS